MPYWWQHSIIISSKAFAVINDPANGSCTIKTQFSSSKTLEMSMVNTLGQVVYKRDHTVPGGDYSFIVEHPTMSPGIYFIQLIADDQVFTEKFAVQ